jgi:hypothetical protein
MTIKLEEYLSNRLLMRYINTFNGNYIRSEQNDNIIIQSVNNEIPIALINKIKDTNINSDTTLISNLKTFKSLSYNTLDSIIFNGLNHNTTLYKGLIKIISEKYGTFYFGRGLIMTEDKNILLLATAKYDQERHEISNIKVHINPIVSKEKSAGISKYIYNQIVPFFLTNKVSYHTINSNGLLLAGYNYIKISFTRDINNFKYSPALGDSNPMNLLKNQEIVNNLVNSICQ